MAMQYMDWVKSSSSQLYTPLCLHLMPPLIRLHMQDYPAELEYDYHTNKFSSACLITSGAMEFKERGCAPFICRAGTLGILPEGSEYCWRMLEATSTLHCLHKAFSSHSHNELALLFGAWRKRASSVDLGAQWTENFMEKLLNLKKSNALEVFFSLASFELLARAVEQLDDSLKSGFVNESEPIVKCIYAIDKNMDRMFSVDELASTVNLSASRLFQLFHAQFGISPIQYIARCKIQTASDLLSSTMLSNGEIAERLGFSSANYFVRFFKKHVGVSPSVFRNKEKARISGHI